MNDFKIKTYNYSFLLVFVIIAFSTIFYLNYVKNFLLSVIIASALFFTIFKFTNKNKIKSICRIEDCIEILYIENYKQKSYKCNLNNIKVFSVEISASNNAKTRHFSSKIVIECNDYTKEFLHENYDIYFLKKLLKNANNLPNFSCKLNIDNLSMIEQKIKSLLEENNILYNK